MIHENGVILQANKQYYEMFGYNSRELAGKDAIPLTVAPESLQVMRSQIASGSLGPYEVTGQRKDGTFFPMEIRARSMEYGGRPVRVAAIRNLTEQKRIEGAFRE